MAVVIDASVALKWVLEEEGFLAARRLVETELLAAPDLLFVECANVLWTKTRKFGLSGQDALAAMQIIENAPVRSIQGRPHVAAAQRISLELGQSAYDSLYLAVALAERMIFVTADAAFSRAALAHPTYARSVRALDLS